MQVLLLSPYSDKVLEPIVSACKETGDIVLYDMPVLGLAVDFTVIWGLRRILRREELERGNIINIHISYLPYNRGASPNLWAWYDNTPHGVSVHQVTEKVDAGPILARRMISFNKEEETLQTSYDKLQEAAGRLFYDIWPFIHDGKITPLPRQNGSGSYHTIAQSEELLAKFPLGYDTPVSEVRKRRETI